MSFNYVCTRFLSGTAIALLFHPAHIFCRCFVLLFSFYFVYLIYFCYLLFQFFVILFHPAYIF